VGVTANDIGKTFASRAKIAGKKCLHDRFSMLVEIFSGDGLVDDENVEEVARDRANQGANQADNSISGYHRSYY
jgi:hypothetical protein